MKESSNKRDLWKLYFWTLSYFKPYMFLTALYVFCGGLLIWGELMIPRRMGAVVDGVLPKGQLGVLITEMLFLSGIVVIILISKVAFNLIEIRLSNQITKNQQLELMKKLQTLGFSYYEKVPTGQILALFENDVKETQKTYTFLFPHLVYSMAQFFVPAVILMAKSPIFFFSAMVGNIIYVALNQYANKKIHFYLGLETKASHESQQFFYDGIVATPELKAMGSQSWFIQKTEDAFNDFRLSRMGSIFWRHFRFTTVGFTLTLSVVLFYVFGFQMIQSGELLVGEFIGYSFLMGLISRGFSVFFYIIPAQQHALNYARHLYAFLNLNPHVSESECREELDGALDIEFDNVSFSYANEKPILNQISLKIPVGQKTAFVGESGCGKSTLIKLLGRFYEVSSGEIRLGGKNIKNYSLHSLRQQLGYVFQEPYLFNASIEDNIKFGNLEARTEAVKNAAKKANAHEFIEKLENGYETQVGERGARLSGGEKQRIALARLFLKAPQIVLLDEATSALDNRVEARVKMAIDEFSEGRTLIGVAHRLSTIRDYDKIVVMDSGKIVEQGDYETLMEQKGYFYRLVMRGENNAV